MGNCLKTQLKENVINSKLQTFGCLTIRINNASNIGVGLYNTSNKAATIRSHSDTVTITSGPSILYKTISGTGNIVLSDKYNLKGVGMEEGVEFDFNDLSGCSNLGTFKKTANLEVVGFNRLSQLNCFANLNYLYVTDGSIIGDIENVILPNLNIIYLNNFIIENKMKKFGKYPLERIDLLATENSFTEDVENMVAMRKAILGNNTGEIIWKLPNVSDIAFNGVKITSNAQRTLSWSDNGDNTVINFGSDSTTIHINSDGTWTRIS